MTDHRQPAHVNSLIQHVRSTAFTLTVAAVVLVVQFVPGLPNLLESDLHAIQAGQVWRLVTGYLTHWSLDHLFWDVLMFVVLGCVIERRSRWRMIGLCLASALAISAGLAFWRADIVLCRGLSGIDTALFTYAAMATLGVAVIQKNWRQGLVAALLLAAFCGKVLYESVVGSALFADSAGAGFHVVVEAHLIGAAIGLLAGLGTSWWRPEVWSPQAELSVS